MYMVDFVNTSYQILFVKRIVKRSGKDKMYMKIPAVLSNINATSYYKPSQGYKRNCDFIALLT